MCYDPTSGNTKLISENSEEVKAFYLCLIMDIDLKFADGTILHLNKGEFIDTSKHNPTHRRYFFQSKFKKLQTNPITKKTKP